MPEVSIVIRAFNEERHLPGLFDGIEAQSLKDLETIVVDSGSYDRTREIAARRATRLLRISPLDFTFGHSLNVGIRGTAGRVVVMVSAHTKPTGPEWLDRLIAPLADEKVAMVYGRHRGNEESKYGELRDFERIFGPDPKTLAPPEYYANNANSAIRRELWERHPFDETLPGLEDIAWVKHWMERGCKVVYEPRACIYHIHSESWAQVRRRYYREGQAAKWIGVQRRRDLPREVLREAGALAGDLGGALREGRLLEKGPEIARFRWEKVLGTIGGVWDGALMENPLQRERFLFDREYRAVVVRGPGSAALEEREAPVLRPGEVLIRVAFVGVCGTDLEVLDGTLGYFRKGLSKYPIVPGHELSGTVVFVGPRVEGVREGDRVVVECIQGCGTCDACRGGEPIACPSRSEVGVMGKEGGYAEYVVAPGRFVHKIPDAMSLRQASLVEPTAVVLKGLRRAEALLGPGGRPGRVAVVGAGTIGHLAALLLKRRGGSVTAFDTNAERLALLAKSGVAGRERLADLKDFDAFVEATGSAQALETVLEGSRPGACVLLLGFPYGARDFDFESIVGYDRAVVGSVGSGPVDFRRAIEELPGLDTSAFMGEPMPLDRFAQAWDLARQGRRLKLVLQPDPRR